MRISFSLGFRQLYTLGKVNIRVEKPLGSYRGKTNLLRLLQQ